MVATPPAVALRMIEGADARRAYERHSRFVARCLQARGVDDGALDDAIQSVFLVAFERWPATDREGAIRAWLRSVAHNVARHHHRSRTRARQREAEGLAVAGPPTPEDHATQREGLEVVQRIVDGMSPVLREAFLLVEVEGMAVTEAAECIGVPLPAMYSRVRYARAAFAKAWAEREEAR
jgi:RNA polymerase sigma-70 factor, ECF subfamily